MKPYEAGWEEQLKAAPLPSGRFGEEHKRSIRARIGNKTARSQRSRAGVAFVCAAAVLLLLGIGAWYGPGWADRSASPGNEAPRQTYYEGDELLLEVFPDPTLKAGMEYGYIFRFTQLRQGIVGKELAIDAVHLETGHRASVVPPYVIEESPLAELDFERYIVQCTLPLGGLWLYEVRLDGQPYANVVLDVGEPDWTASPTFRSGSYEMTGIEGVIGFIDAGFIAGRPNKYMWHAWGAPSDLEGEFEVRAVKQGRTEIIPVIQGRRLGGSLNGADASMPSNMVLPDPGVWRLLPYIDGQLVESIVVQVKPQDGDWDNSRIVDPRAVTTEQLKKVTEGMTYAELMEVIGDSADIGSGRFIKTYRHTDGMSFTLNYGSSDEILSADVYLTIQELINSEQP